MHYSDWFWGAVHDSFLDSKPTFFTVEAFFHVSGYVSAQNNRYWKSINPGETSELPLYDLYDLQLHPYVLILVFKNRKETF
jgi:hypothetical protein